MKVKIGPYINWIGPYQIADMVFFWLDKHPTDEQSETRIYKLHDWLGNYLAGREHDVNGKRIRKDTRLMKFCEWVHKHRKRKEYVKLDYYDHWNANHTLALIILPILKALKEHKQGSPLVDFEDVPDHLWPQALPGASNNYTDDTTHERWAWVLDEMIWTFEQELDEDDESKFYDHTGADDPNDSLMTQVSKIKVDREGLDLHCERKTNGFRLFGKYYQGLWD